jgi:hypothetical protein
MQELVKAASPEVLEKIESFVKALNKAVPAKALRENQGRKYLPIGYIEWQLDRFFKGLWSCEVVSYSQLVDSVAVHVRLKVFIPGFGYITRDGLGAVPIQLAKGASRTDFAQIVSGAIQKNLPSAKSFALSNAAESLGQAFGRNLNRKDWMQHGYTPDESLNESYLNTISYEG